MTAILVMLALALAALVVVVVHQGRELDALESRNVSLRDRVAALEADAKGGDLWR